MVKKGGESVVGLIYLEYVGLRDTLGGSVVLRNTFSNCVQFFWHVS